MKAFLSLPLALLALASFGCGKPPTSELGAAAGSAPQEPAAKNPGEDKRAKGSPRDFQYDAVEVNHDVEVPDGFRGDVHPLLRPETQLEVSAHWTPTLKEVFYGGLKLGKVDNAEVPEYSLPDDLIKLLTQSTPAVERATYGAKDLSVFLPNEIEGVGQMWAIDPEATESFLKQIHPGVSTTFDRYHQPYGRRPGPAGGFGFLRAVSPAYLDILFRLHAEFALEEGVVIYTPACFLGRLLLNRDTGAIDYLQMRVPTDLAVNVNITLTFRHPDRPRQEVTNIVFELVDPMELVGGDEGRLAGVTWEEDIDVEAAHHRLKSAFYKFMDIEWVPPEDMLAIAKEENKPILLVLLTSPLDDQSC